VIDCVVAPLLQAYDAAEDDVSVTEPPAQNVVGPPAVIAGAGSGLTVTLAGADVALQPAFVTVTVYVPPVETVIDGVVAPFDQEYDDAPLAADNVTEPPAQNVVGPLAVIAASGGA